MYGRELASAPGKVRYVMDGETLAGVTLAAALYRF